MALPTGRMMRALLRRVAGLALALAGLVFAPLAIAFGVPWGLAGTLVAGLLIYGWHLYQVRRLLLWVGGPLDAALPEANGLWGDVFSALHRRVRKRLEKERQLARRLERFVRAFQALPDGVIAFDRQHHIEWMNAQAEAHFALNEAEDRGQALTNLIRHPDFVAYLNAGDFSEPLILGSARVSGLSLMIQVLPYDEEMQLLVSRDVSQFERIERMRRDFIANVSHELKTPLTVVAGFSEMLNEDFETFSTAEVRHYLALIGDQNARMQRLIEDLLTLSALETGGVPPRQESVDMPALLHSVWRDAEALSAGRHALSLSVNAAPRMEGCTSELRSAFGNLAGNAVRYTPSGGYIELLWRQCPGGAEFVVRDTGIGIAAEHLPRLTERFYRVDRGRSRETGGTGLGLAIVKHVLTRHGGVLDIASTPGVGSEFSARFPAQRLNAQADTEDAVPSGAKAANS